MKTSLFLALALATLGGCSGEPFTSSSPLTYDEDASGGKEESGREDGGREDSDQRADGARAPDGAKEDGGDAHEEPREGGEASANDAGHEASMLCCHIACNGARDLPCDSPGVTCFDAGCTFYMACSGPVVVCP